jgi:hypothetical protein
MLLKTDFLTELVLQAQESLVILNSIDYRRSHIEGMSSKAKPHNYQAD